MSTDYRVDRPEGLKIKITCYRCGKDINPNDITEGHIHCLDEVFDGDDICKRLNIDIDFVPKVFVRKAKYTNELLSEYHDICAAGFKGSVEDFLEYKKSYGKDVKKRVRLENNPFSDDDIPF